MRDDGFYSTPEIAEHLSISYQAALDWAQDNDLPRVGASFVWTQVAVDAFAAELDDGDERDEDDGFDAGDADEDEDEDDDDDDDDDDDEDG
jgi:hypothetical protein